jgi:hypothetical protein
LRSRGWRSESRRPLTNGGLSIEDYAPCTAETQASSEAQNGQQGGDVARLAQALVTIAGQEQPPRRFVTGADAIGIAEQKASLLMKIVLVCRRFRLCRRWDSNPHEVALTGF